MATQLKKSLGWGVLILISLVPVFLWYYLGPGTSDLTDYSSTVHSLGEIFGLVGMTMFALTFVLSTRIPAIEDIFGGLDKVYIVHAILGGSALILILAHPIFLVLKFVPADMATAATYLLPSSYWSVNFGIIALIGLISLIYITLYTKMRYHRWKFTHEFLGLMFALAVLHIFLVRGTISQDNIFDGYYVYAATVSLVGLGSFSYSLFLKNRIMKNAIYRIQDIKQSQNLFELQLIPEHKPIQYESGQFVFLRFYNETLSKESHPFSIASKSNSQIIRIVIKKLGDFTNKLENLKIGDRVSLEGPYGRFHYKRYKGKNQIWIAAGIGVTPFIGMAEELGENKKSADSVDLYYTVSDDKDFVGYNLFSEISTKTKNFKFIPWNSSSKGRINVQEIKKISGKFEGKEFFLCGPTQFKEGIIRDLVSSGVSKDRIHEEAFDFR